MGWAKLGAQATSMWAERESEGLLQGPGEDHPLSTKATQGELPPWTGILSSSVMAEDQEKGAKGTILLQSKPSALSPVVSLRVLEPCLTWVWQTNREAPP